MDTVARSGDEAPGLLRLGIEERIEVIRSRVVGELARGLRGYLAGAPPAGRCRIDARHGPKVRFRSAALDGEEKRTVAVVPFLDLTKRRGAGDAVSTEFVRQLVASGRFRVLEPGVVRDYLLRARVMMPGGVSLETVRLIVGELGAQLVLSGMVLDFDEDVSMQGPSIRFSATMIDAGTSEVIWSSRSANRGDDGVFLFGLGRVRTAPELACRMVASTVDQLGRPGGTQVAWPARRWETPARLSHERRRPPAPPPVPENVAGIGGEGIAPDAGKDPGKT